MTLDNLLPMVAMAGLFDLALVMVLLVIVILRSFSKQSPLNVRLKVIRNTDQEAVKAATAAAPAPPPEAVPGPDFQWPEPEADGKVPVKCGKCGTEYRVYPNRLWYTCTKCQEKVWVVKDSMAAAPAKKEAKPKTQKVKSSPNLL